MIREKQTYMKCNCKQSNFLWFLLLSTPFMFYFYSYTPTSTPSPHISNLIPCISTPILQFPALILCIPHIPTLVLHKPTPIPHFHAVIRVSILAFTNGCRNRYFNEFENTFNQLQKQYQTEWVVTTLKNTQERVQF